MADKKRTAAPKVKKTVAKKTTKPTQDLETKTVPHKEEEMEQHEELKSESNTELSNVPLDNEEAAPGNEPHPDDEDRQPYFNNPRNGEGVRPQDVRPSDEYTIETFFDKNQRLFIATVVEYPELRCTGHTRDEAQVDLEERLEDHVYDLRARGGQMAEPVQSRHYPEKLELPLSQSLFRKLDQMSRHEKLPIDRLIAELLAAALERRGGQNRSAQSQQQQHHNRDHRDREHHGGGHHNNQNRHGGGNNHRNHGGNRGGGGGQRGNYRALDSRENFMEYVRNLEKGGGQGGWKKR